MAVRSERAETIDYAASLQLLKTQHLLLSAQREQLDQSAKRQRDCAADLAARVEFLQKNLAAQEQKPEEAAACGILDELLSTNGPDSKIEHPALNSSQPTVADYESAVIAARHCQSIATQLLHELRAVHQLMRLDALTGMHSRRSPVRSFRSAQSVPLRRTLDRTGAG